MIFIIAACVPPTEQEYFEINVDYSDPGLRKILELEVRQELDSLLLFVSHPNPTYRLITAKSFASFQAPEAIDSMVKLLNDPFIEVKTAAAFTLGQIGAPSSADELLKAFSQQDSIDVNNTFNNAVLEAMGKIGPESYLNAIATVNTYRSSDTLLVLGQAHAIYQYGLRSIFDPEGDKTMVKFVTGNYPLSVQKIAAQYFFRFENANIDETKFQLLKVMKEHKDPDVRMALATAITRKGYQDLQSEILDFYSTEKDYRVKCNILRQIHKYPYISIVENVLREISNVNEKVGLCAAEYLMENGNGYDAPVYLDYVKSDLNPFIKIKVYQSLMKNSGRGSGSRYTATAALKEMALDESLNQYVRAEALIGLAEDYRSTPFIIEQFKSDNPSILKTRTVESLVKILKSKEYVPNATKKEIAVFIEKAITEGTGGMVSAATAAFNDEELKFADQFENLDFLTNTLNRLVIPNEIETYNELNAAIAKINGREKPEPKVSDNIKPINWDLFDQYSAFPEIRISTNKGEIVIRLFKNEAPHSVMNIIELVKSGYYNNKYFHRVIPNFVAQTGCPDGDGYGSLDYTIRSELNNVHYNDEGYVGYASAGLHTESTQWFVTYSPTPHLDGKYSLFGKVLGSMDIVDQLEVGDKISRISITN
ncbi:hypothetical protein GCM10007940_31110 [Portibacter lacus]|uniref:peptidylprolyl isomerase n=1 Tax=Portibacter lacus TaxID=1099794 RepID=A0AA37WH78_9BACT|nr:hypothetical protein GCM10007940_31110 [Portibacter lacus]